MITIQQTEGTEAVLRKTPWDEKAFGFPTSEILSIRYDGVSQLRLLLRQIDHWNLSQGIRYCVTRVPASDTKQIAAVQDAGFYFAETSFRLSKSNLNSFSFDAVTRRRVTLRPAEEADRSIVQQIAATDFKFGRFLEDPYLDSGLASQRHLNWVSDLLDKECVQVAINRDIIIGFHAQKVAFTGCEADLILTGTTRKYAMLSLPLWVSALESLQTAGVTRAKTMISAANIGVLNLYGALAFHFDAALLGFHKRY